MSDTLLCRLSGAAAGSPAPLWGSGAGTAQAAAGSAAGAWASAAQQARASSSATWSTTCKCMSDLYPVLMKLLLTNIPQAA